MSTFTDIGVKVLVLSIVLALLPSSPFVGFSYLVENIPFLGWLNWFLPISEMLVIFESLLIVIVAYYGILYLLNYVGVLKS